MAAKVIITGSTGMVGEGVLYECLQSKQIEKILVINRKPCGYTHPKLTEIIHPDFFDLSNIANQLKGYDGCLFCLGISSVGMKEEAYSQTTYELTLNFAKILATLNPQMVFCYVSGTGTDSTEKGKIMWARVKGKTENDLMKLSFKKVYNFRPGYMQPTKGMKYTNTYYKYISWLYPLLKTIMPKYVSTLAELGQAMINVLTKDYEKNIIEVKDILVLAKQ